MAKLKVKRFHPSVVTIDGQRIRIRVSRFTLDTLRAFADANARVEDPPSERPLKIRKPGDEMEQRPKVRPRTAGEIAAAEALERVRDRLDDEDLAAFAALIPEESTELEFVIPDSEIRERRLAEMSADVRAAWALEDQADEEHAARFVTTAIMRHVTVEAGEIELEDDDGSVRDATTGSDLLLLYGGRRSVLRALLACIWYENTLDGTLKNVWRSAFGSGASSAEPDPEAVGATPVPPATSAALEGSVTSAAVMASTAAALSGPTALSS